MSKPLGFRGGITRVILPYFLFPLKLTDISNADDPVTQNHVKSDNGLNDLDCPDQNLAVVDDLVAHELCLDFIERFPLLSQQRACRRFRGDSSLP